MRVGLVNISFKSAKHPVVMGFDDSVSSEKRKYIRNHMEQNIMPYRDIFEREHRLSEYELNNLIGVLTNFTNPNNVVKNLDENDSVKIYNLKKMTAKNSYRGRSLVAYLDNLVDVKKAGVNQVIDLVGYKDLKDACEKVGLKYSSFLVGKVIWDEAKYGDIYKAKDAIVEFIHNMQKESFYIGCEWGFGDTDTAIAVDYVFNPKTKSSQPLFLRREEIEIFKNLFMCLSEDDLKKMGYKDTDKIITCSKIDILDSKMQEKLGY